MAIEVQQLALNCDKCDKFLPNLICQKCSQKELLEACKRALKICKFQQKQFDIDDKRYISWEKQIKYFKEIQSKATK